MLKEKILQSFDQKENFFDAVLIKKEAILNFQKKHSRKIKDLEKSIENDIKKHLLSDIKNTLNFLFLIRTLDFSLWKNENYSYEDLRKNLFLIYKKEKNPEKFLLNLSLKKFREIFNFKEAPYISRLRLKLLKEKIKWLFLKKKGNFLNFLKENQSPEKFCFSLFIFDDFKDYYVLKEKRIYILKPNQLLYFACQKALEHFGKKAKNLDDLTVFADNVLPAVLQREGILEYNDKLKYKIKNKKNIQRGSIEEISIRVKTILACEEIAKKLNLPSWKVDQLLWGKLGRGKIYPHRTFSFFY